MKLFISVLDMNCLAATSGFVGFITLLYVQKMPIAFS